MSELRVRVLGPLTVERAGKPVALGGPQARAVLALLLLDAGRVASVDRLIDALWSGEPPPSARVQLQGHISHLRRAFGDAGAALVTRTPGYLLRLPPETLDLHVFQEGAAAARALLAAGDNAGGAAKLRTALAHWRGEAYADIELPAVRAEAEHLDELRVAALEERIEADLALGRAHELVPELVALVADHPMRERLSSHLMVALARFGRVADALAEYRRIRQLLVEELGLEPSEQLRTVHAGILRAEPGLRPGSTMASGRQVAVPRMLPADIPDFTGREAQVAQMRVPLTAATRATPPIVAVTGPGGVGKTALLVHVANQLVDHYPDGQLFVRLHGASADPVTPAAALAQVLRGLGISDAAMPGDTGERAGLYRSLLAGRRVLAVLDDARDEEQVRQLLPGAPECGVLISSRRRLGGLEGAVAVSLTVLSPEESVTLLYRIAGAGRVAEQPEAAAAVAEHCGGLPLAVRIVGARLANRPQWTVEDLERRLTDERKRLDWLTTGDLAVRASLLLSYRQLDADHQRLFRRLGLLDAPDFASWVAAAVLDAVPDPAERLLEDLVDAHLVEPAGRGATGPRYQLHDLLRLLARELAEAEEPAPDRDASRDRALSGWVALAETAAAVLGYHAALPCPTPPWQPPPEAVEVARTEAMRWFDDEVAVLLVTVRQAADASDPILSWPLAQHLSGYLALRLRVEEWRQGLEQARNAAVRGGDRHGEAVMWQFLADQHMQWSEYDDARSAIARAREAYDAAGFAHHGAYLCRIEGWMLYNECDFPAAMAAFAAGRTAAEQVGDRHAEVAALFGQLSVRAEMEDLAPWAHEYAAVVAEYRTLSAVGSLDALHSGALILRRLGREAEAEQQLMEEHRLGEQWGIERHVAEAQTALALLYADTGRADDEAVRLAASALEWFRSSGQRWGIGRTLRSVAKVAWARGDLNGAAERFREALAIWSDLGMPWYIRITLQSLADLCHELGDLEAEAVYREELRRFDDGQSDK